MTANSVGKIEMLTCPFCHNKERKEIPESKCLASYRCGECGRIVFANEKCCVFCEYGSAKCPVSEEMA